MNFRVETTKCNFLVKDQDFTQISYNWNSKSNPILSRETKPIGPIDLFCRLISDNTSKVVYFQEWLEQE